MTDKLDLVWVSRVASDTITSITDSLKKWTK